MAQLSTANKTKLNKMNRAAKDAGLGTIVQTLTGISAGSATMSGSEIDIDTGLASVSAWMVQASRSGSQGGKVIYAASASTAGHIKVSSGCVSGSLAANDVLFFIAK
jgi:hypothetical protein